MSNLREAAQQALEALREIHPGNMTPMAEEAWDKAITALKAALEQPDECSWMQDGDHDSDMWAAGCGRHRYFTLNEGTPSENGMKHCCYCGKPLVEVPIEEDDYD